VAVTGPDFISLQVRDLERSAVFYQQYLGLKRSDAGPPHAVVFDTKPIAFAVRLSARRRAVRPHFHVRGPRRLPGDPPRPRLSRGG
jgi:catechol-2,3-dioxygenase